MHTLKEILTEPQTMYDGGLVSMQDGGYAEELIGLKEPSSVEAWINPETGQEMLIPLVGGMHSFPPPPGFKRKEEEETELIPERFPGGGIDEGEGQHEQPDPVGEAWDSLSNDNPDFNSMTAQEQAEAVAYTSMTMGVTPGQLADRSTWEAIGRALNNALNPFAKFVKLPEVPRVTRETANKAEQEQADREKEAKESLLTMFTQNQPGQEAPSGAESIGDPEGKESFSGAGYGYGRPGEAEAGPGDMDPGPGTGDPGDDPWAQGGLVRPMYDGGLV